MQGIFGVYKPKGPSSNQFLNQLRRQLGTKKIGHAGTLDPLASGILVVGVGREATKRLDQEVQKEKEYVAKIKLGETSVSGDAEGPIEQVDVNNDKNITQKDVELALPQFIGVINQVPPIYSAVKVDGREAYKLARQGLSVKMKPRSVEIKEIELLGFKWPFLDLRVVTGPGVYIRSLAGDLGQVLGVGGYLAQLERIRVGEFTKDRAKNIELKI